MPPSYVRFSLKVTQALARDSAVVWRPERVAFTRSPFRRVPRAHVRYRPPPTSRRQPRSGPARLCLLSSSSCLVDRPAASTTTSSTLHRSARQAGPTAAPGRVSTRRRSPPWRRLRARSGPSTGRNSRTRRPSILSPPSVSRINDDSLTTELAARRFAARAWGPRQILGLPYDDNDRPTSCLDLLDTHQL